MTFEYKLFGKSADTNRELIQDVITANKELKIIDKRSRKLRNFLEKHEEEVLSYLWKNSNGETLSILDMDNSYLLNLNNFIKRNYNSIEGEIECDIDDTIEVIEGEIERRALLNN